MRISFRNSGQVEVIVSLIFIDRIKTRRLTYTQHYDFMILSMQNCTRMRIKNLTKPWQQTTYINMSAFSPKWHFCLWFVQGYDNTNVRSLAKVCNPRGQTNVSLCQIESTSAFPLIRSRNIACFVYTWLRYRVTRQLSVFCLYHSRCSTDITQHSRNKWQWLMTRLC